MRRWIAAAVLSVALVFVAIGCGNAATSHAAGAPKAAPAKTAAKPRTRNWRGNFNPSLRLIAKLIPFRVENVKGPGGKPFVCSYYDDAPSKTSAAFTIQLRVCVKQQAAKHATKPSA